MIKKFALGLVLTAAMIINCKQYEDKATQGNLLGGVALGLVPASTAKVLRDKIKNKEHGADFYLGFALSKVVSAAVFINVYETTKNEAAALAAISSFGECGILAAAGSYSGIKTTVKKRKAIKRGLINLAKAPFKAAIN